MAATVPIATAASIDQRFAQLIQQFGLTKNSFAISLGKTASVVQHLIDGRNKPGFDLMCKVFEVYPNVSRDWLLLGRGPMLIGSPAGAAALPAAPAAATETDFEPIDLADVALRAPRRASTTRLHPEEIAATLALASVAANGGSVAPLAEPLAVPAQAAANATVAAQDLSAALPESGSPVAIIPQNPAAKSAPQRPTRRFQPAAVPVPPLPVSAPAPEPAAAPVPPVAPVAAAVVPEPLTVPVPPAPTAPALNPDAYVTAAIHAQHMQHQLALAELRNQHLLEQQQMLREMLAMARQQMV